MIESSSKVTEVPEITSSLVKTECKSHNRIVFLKLMCLAGNDICYSTNLIYGYIRKGHDRYVFDAYVVKSAEACCSYCSMLPCKLHVCVYFVAMCCLRLRLCSVGLFTYSQDLSFEEWDPWPWRRHTSWWSLHWIWMYCWRIPTS